VPHLFFSDDEYVVIEAACGRLIPGAVDAGVADYVDGLLGAFAVDPPRIWAGGPFSGRHGGQARFATFTALSPLDELAWRTRIEGSLGLPEREFNGPVVGLQEQYRDGLDPLGAHVAAVDDDEQDERLRRAWPTRRTGSSWRRPSTSPRAWPPSSRRWAPNGR
jgi:hypothetical protein